MRDLGAKKVQGIRDPFSSRAAGEGEDERSIK
jgi:hypothetical protein